MNEQSSFSLAPVAPWISTFCSFWESLSKKNMQCVAAGCFQMEVLKPEVSDSQFMDEVVFLNKSCPWRLCWSDKWKSNSFSYQMHTVSLFTFKYAQSQTTTPKAQHVFSQKTSFPLPHPP